MSSQSVPGTENASRHLPGKLSVYIVDDHDLTRHGIKSFLEGIPGLSIIGEAGSWEEARSGIETLRPEVAIVDISLNGKSGIDLIRAVRRAYPTLKVIVYTQHDLRVLITAALSMGVNGFVVKNDHPAELSKAIKAVANNTTYFSKKVIAALGYDQPGSDPRRAVLNELSATEFEILKLVARGLRNHEIAGQLHCSVRTIEGHRQNLMNKLNIHTAAGLTLFALQENVIDLPSPTDTDHP